MASQISSYGIETRFPVEKAAPNRCPSVLCCRSGPDEQREVSVKIRVTPALPREAAVPPAVTTAGLGDTQEKENVPRFEASVQ